MNGKVIVIGLGVLLLAVVGVIGATYTPGTIETARIGGEEARVVELNGRELGLNCITNTEGCAEMIARAEKNSQLKSAFLKAKAMDVGIQPRAVYWLSVGSVGRGWVTINTLYSDEKIIAFLMK
ncbi:MAG: hypothetical protein G01um101448_498 [Parcubacteria group bacterium Gr01-1014_48]|nr:MAG: hypothetical protein Greene041614_817 [Parcubacteria group bacterium Greene0416_14]TSC73855.1 MAG: hypothetical protein G01um101448_498 [Parcubacteria group bacterium Gr01-1014_48]TSD00408.1 MAG: hypothetical protein Greene101415_866 [Parcubacteria group bacterium Greene1014_15]TSD07527.1 MAG: hypothetical protein Greene07144_869 [Parcubacteria group bacterium Greene0714_4]